MNPRATLLALSILAACGGQDGGAKAGEDPSGEVAFELRDVVAAALSARPPRPAADPLDPEDADLLEGLPTLIASAPSMRDVVLEDLARIGSGAWAPLARFARSPEHTDAERAAAVDLLAAESGFGADELLGLSTDGEPAWIRARAAEHLATGGPDHLVPALVLRLKYEPDHETVVWIAVALARHGNLAGLDALSALADDATSPARANAAQQLGLLLEHSGRVTAGDLWRAWQEPGDERGFSQAPRSDAYRYAILECIARLGEFQLRGVDDARFVLERMDAGAARELAAALHDEDVYVRVHAAQCLRRMGRRGVSAGPELLLGLTEPELAPHAAAALGAIGYAPAEGVLVLLLGPDTPFALRLASARALGHLSALTREEAARALRPLLAADPPELAQAAAESLLRRDPGALDVAARLADFLEDPQVDPGSSERALRDWLEATQAAEEILRWEELAAPRDRVETPAETRRRRKERSALVRELAGG